MLPTGGGDRLGGPQDQVVVLRAVEPVAEATDVGDDRAAQDRQVAGVHRRAEALRRPVRLGERHEVGAVGEHVQLVGVQVVDAVVRVGVQRGGHLCERRGDERVVVVEQGDDLARGHRQRVVRRGDDAAVALAVQDTDAWFDCGELVERLDHLGSGGAVVDQAPLPVGERLGAHAVGARQERAERRVVDGGDDREPGDDARTLRARRR